MLPYNEIKLISMRVVVIIWMPNKVALFLNPKKMRLNLMVSGSYLMGRKNILLKAKDRKTQFRKLFI